MISSIRAISGSLRRYAPLDDVSTSNLSAPTAHSAAHFRQLLIKSGVTILILSFILIFLTSCGFRPIYGENHNSLPIKLVSVQTLRQDYGKLDYIMRQELEKAFNPLDSCEPAQYTMTVRMLKTVLSFDTQSNRVSTRQRVDLRVDFILTDLNGKKVTEDFVVASDSFDITISPYSSLISEEETTNLLAKSLAQEITLRVAATLSSR